MASSSNPLTGLDIPIAEPPPGYSQVLTNPPSQGYILIIISSIFLTLMVCSFLIRVYTKICISKEWGLDDYFSTLALVLTAAYAAVALSTLKSGVGVHEWDILASAFTDSLLQKFYFIEVILAPMVLFVKLSLLLSYLKVFHPNVTLRYLIYFGILFTSLFYTACFLVQIILCTPRSGESWFTVTISPRYAKTIPLGVVQGAIGAAIDFYILFVPIRGIWQLQLPLQRKIGILTIFFSGFLACIASILNLVYRTKLNRSGDVTWNLMLILAFTVLETCVGTTCGCMLSFAKFFHYHTAVPRFLRYLASYTMEKLDVVRTAFSKRTTPGHSKDSSLTLSNNDIAMQEGKYLTLGTQFRDAQKQNLDLQAPDFAADARNPGVETRRHWWDMGLISNFSVTRNDE